MSSTSDFSVKSLNLKLTLKNSMNCGHVYVSIIAFEEKPMAMGSVMP